MLCGEARASIVVPVSAATVWALVAPFPDIAKWGHAVVSHSYIENAHHATEVGAIRTVVLRQAVTPDAAGDDVAATTAAKLSVALREKLIAVEESLDGMRAVATFVALPCERAPYPHAASNLTTTLSVSGVTTAPRDTHVELRATFACASPEATQEMSAWLEQMLYGPLLHCLADVALEHAFALDRATEGALGAELAEYQRAADLLFSHDDTDGAAITKAVTELSSRRRDDDGVAVVGSAGGPAAQDAHSPPLPPPSGGSSEQCLAYHTLLASWIALARRVRVQDAAGNACASASTAHHAASPPSPPVRRAIPEGGAAGDAAAAARDATRVYTPDELTGLSDRDAGVEFSVLDAKQRGTLDAATVRRFWEHTGRYGAFSASVFAAAVDEVTGRDDSDPAALDRPHFAALLRNIGSRL